LFDTFTVAFYILRPTPAIAKLTTRHAMSEGILRVIPYGYPKVVLRVIRLRDKEIADSFLKSDSP
jgi:hypothetical protein